MRMMLCARLVALLLLVAALFGVSPAMANDSTAEIGAGGPVLARSAEIEMAEETLLLSPDAVTVDYVFRNRTDADIESLVAFPMPDIRFGLESDWAIPVTEDNFLGFTVNAGGQVITPELQQRAVNDAGLDITDLLLGAGLPLAPLENPWTVNASGVSAEVLDELVTLGAVVISGSGENREVVPQWTLKSVNYWTMRFPAGRDLAVAHRYKPAVGGSAGLFMFDGEGKASADYRTGYCVDDAFIAAVKRRQGALPTDGSEGYTEAWLSYVLHTGANWAGLVGRFTLMVDKGSPGNLVSFCGTGVKKTGPTTFEVVYEDFEPRGDLDVLVVRKWE